MPSRGNRRAFPLGHHSVSAVLLGGCHASPAVPAETGGSIGLAEAAKRNVLLFQDRSDHASLTANINGVGHDYFAINGMKLLSGKGLSSAGPSMLGQQAVLDDRTAAALFPNNRVPLGRTIMIDRMPATVVGVVQRPRSAAGDRTLQIDLIQAYNQIFPTRSQSVANTLHDKPTMSIHITLQNFNTIFSS